MSNKPTYEELEKRLKKKETENEELKKNQRFIDRITKTVPVTIYIFDLINNCNIYTNESGTQVLGYTKEETSAAGSKIIETVTHPDDIDKVSDHLQKIKMANDDEVIEYEYRMMHKDGSFRWLRSREMVFERDNNAVPTLMIGTAQDITSRKIAEEELLFLSSITERINDAIIATNKDFKITYINKAAEEMFGYTLDELKDKDPGIFNAEVLADEIQNEIYRTVASGNTYSRESINRRKDGSKFYCDYSITPLKNNCDEIYAYVAVQRDISQRKQVEEELEKHRISQLKKAEQALRDSEERYYAMFDNMSSGAAIYESINNGEDYIFKAFNREAEKITNIDRNEALSNRLLKLFPHMDQSELIGALNRVRKTGQKEFLFPFYYEDNLRKGWFENRIYKLPSGEVVALFDDVTEKVEVYDQLKESENRYRSLFENNHITMLLINPDNLNIVDANPAAAQFYGWTREVLKTKKIHDINILTPIEIENEMQKAQTQKRNHFHFKHRLANGSIRDVEVYSGTIIIGGRKLLYSLVYDITQRLIALEEKEKLQEQLQQSQKMETIGTLAGGIAHDFNNILFPIIGHADMILNELSENNPNYEIINIILQSAKRGRDLIKHILTFSRQGQQQLRPLKIHSIVNEAIKFSRSTIPTSIKIKSHINKDCGFILCDPTQIHQIVMNLITNAFHAINKKIEDDLDDTNNEIEIIFKEVEIDNSINICLTISDTGCGIEQSKIDRIFEPYFTTKEKDKGTGLGLSVVHGIVKSYDGFIQVKSTPGVGSKFSIFFPPYDYIQEEDFKEKNKSEIIEKGTERILLVDDEESIVKMLYKMLEQLDYNISYRMSSIDTLEKFKANPHSYDLIITDMNMPNMTGDVLSKKLKEIRPDIPIIICTGFSEILNTEKAKAIGIDGFLMKPVVQQELAKEIRKVLDKNKCKKQSFNILTVDDDPFVRKTQQYFLTKAGYNVIQAENGFQALDFFKKEHVDMILMDIKMPKMDGFETTKAIRAWEAEKKSDGEIRQRIPIYILSGYDSPEEKELALEAGADDFLVKTTEMSKILQIIKSK